MVSKSSKKPQDINHQLNQTPVAVIGMASIFPKAQTLNEYWDNILNKINCVTEVPESRWNVADYYDPDPSKPDKSYCKRGAFLPDIDFDPTEFGLPPNILEVTDVSQLLSLVVAKDALQDAGYGEGKDFNRENTGVILGVVGISTKLYVPLMSRLQYPVWERVLKASGVSEQDTQKLIEKFKLAYVNWEENSFPGTLANVIAGRIANRFDLGGTNCVLDAACATSLAAIKMATMELVEGRMDMMITGGVDTDNSIGVYMSFSKTPAFSKGESVRTFDADSDGMMAGEGLGMLVLKRLADAERDGDRIYAVIRGIGSSSDGRFKSIYAPRPAGQAKALRRTYQEAGYSPATVGLIEAHGTGTPAGDPAEFQGLREVFAEDNPNRQYIALGSAKSQIAHTKGAAGSAGMIKAVLALHHKILPPTINVKQPNPKFDIENTPFYINTETRPWFRQDANTPRRASVSAFGFGGTNFHIAMEEYSNDHQGPYRTQMVAQTLLFSAPTSAELLANCQTALTSLQSDQTAVFYNQLVDQSQVAEIPLTYARLGFVASSSQETQELLKTGIDLLMTRQEDTTWEHPKGIYYRQTGIDSKGKVVALFSGQGSQYLEMGRELVCNFPPLRKSVAEMDDLFVKDGLQPLSWHIFPPPVFDQTHRDQLSDVLTRTEYAQPAIGAFSVGLYQLLKQAGFEPDFTAGHSFGELTALWAAGVLNNQDYYSLAKERGKAMAPPEDANFDAGTMLAVKAEASQVKQDIKDFPDITLANWNSNNQVVLAGSKPAIQRVQQYLSVKGYSVVLLPVSAAFHTPLVGHAQKPFAAAIHKAVFNVPKTRLYSNTTGKAHSSNPDEIRELLVGHILNPVLFKDEIENIYAEGGQIFVEFGPKSVLTNLVKDILAKRPYIAVALNANPKKDSDRQFREAVLQLRVAGLPLTNVDPYQAPRRVVSTRKKSAATVKLNGSAYVSPKTIAAFENALKDGFKITTTAIPAPSQTQAPNLNSIQVTPMVTSIPTPTLSTQLTGAPTSSVSSPATSNLLEQSLAQLSQRQSEVVHSHEQYLKNEEMYASIFAKLSELEISMVSNISADKLASISSVFTGLERSMDRFHDHQAETLRIHQQYLKYQQEFSQNYVKLTQQQYGLSITAPVELSLPPVVAVSPVSTPAGLSAPETAQPQKLVQTLVPQEAALPVRSEIQMPAPVVQPAFVTLLPQVAVNSQYDAQTLTTALLNVVSEKTGYPVEMLELDTDMESDLGIDSIKRVEIMGAMRAMYPNLSKVDPESFAEVHTLGQIVAYMSAGKSEDTVAVPLALVSNNDSVPVVFSVEATPVKPNAAPIEAPTAAYDVQALTAALLNVVSEKTGYPVEMLELDTDMESDLGIDSIKRVEIMGAMRALYPNLSKVDPESFAEVHTLGQIVAYMGCKEENQGKNGLLSEPVAKISPIISIPRGVVNLKILPAPDFSQFTLPENHICLLTDDGTLSTGSLAQQLVAQGWKVVVLSFPSDFVPGQMPLPAGINRVTLLDLSETHLQQQLAEIATQFGPVAALVHLNPSSATSQKDGIFSKSQIEIIKHVFLLAKYLKEPLTTASKNNQSAFMVVVRLDGEFGLGNKIDFDPISGGLFGLVKTLNLEWKSVFCRAVDISPEVDPEKAVNHIIAELHDPNRLITEVAYTPQERSTLVVEQDILGEVKK